MFAGVGNCLGKLAVLLPRYPKKKLALQDLAALSVVPHLLTSGVDISEISWMPISGCGRTEM
jgi:hypothetical protein